MAFQQRRRKATKAELEQGQKEMEAAHKRLEQQRLEGDELPLEDQKEGGKGGEGIAGLGGSHRGELQVQGAPSTSAPGANEDSRTRASASTSTAKTPQPTVRTPQQVPMAKTPVRPQQGVQGEPREAERKEEVEGLRTPEDRAVRPGPSPIEGKGEKGKKGVEEDSMGGHEPLVVSMSTPPEEQLPLFSREQIAGLHAMYEQAPLLYPKFQTPQSVLRPPFLEEAKEEARRFGFEPGGEGLQGFEERMKEREEKDEMVKQMQLLMKENQRLGDQTLGILAAERRKEERETLHARQLQVIVEENRALKNQVHRLSYQLENKDEEVIFATPNGSSGLEEDLRGEAARAEEKEEEEMEDIPKGRTGKGTGGRKKEEPSGEAIPPQTIDVILRLMQGMQDIQKKLVKSHLKEDGNEEAGGPPEVVQRSADLPKLAEWSPETGPIDFSDWLLVIQTLMGDLSSSSEEWWQATVEAAKSWYMSHMGKTPLERLQHHPTPSPMLTQKKWARLERRAASLLLAAIPEGLREEVVSSRSLSTLGILTKGMIQYQPGGLAEKSAILAALEGPQEAQSIASGVTTLRRWLRWKRRAEDLGVSIPDATILVRGLGKLMKKLSATYADLNFRLQLTRNQLMVDTIPTQESVTKYSHHLLAELETMGHQAKKKEVTTEPPKLKKFEEQSKDQGTKDNKEIGNKEKSKCRFYLSDSGCKRGKGCTFSHDQKDEKRRFWNCGGTDHMSPACTRPKEGKEGPKPRIAKAEKGKDGKEEVKEQEEASGSVQPSVKDLLEEANKMLKSLNSSPLSSTSSPTAQEGEEREEVMERLQKQLNALRQKAFRLMRLKRGEKAGLLDSGATHPLRPIKRGENKELYEKVQVALADGQTTWLPITPGGVMITEDQDIEPIIPMGQLTKTLDCKVTWSRGSLEVIHPVHGKLPVDDCEGCPQVPKKVAIQLIDARTSQKGDEVQGGGRV